MPTSRQENSASTLVVIVTLTLVLVALFAAKEILLPVALAVFLTFLLTPLIRRLERRGVPRVPAVLITVLFAFTIIGGTGWLVTNQIIDLSEKLPDYRGNFIKKIRSVAGATQGRIGKATETIKEIGEELSHDQEEKADDDSERQVDKSELTGNPRGVWAYLLQGKEDQVITNPEDNAVSVKVVSLPPSPLQQVNQWLGPLVSPLTTAGIVIILVLFFAIYREDMRNRFIELTGRDNLRATTEALDQATHRVTTLLRMQLLVNVMYGIAVGIGLFLIGIPNAFLWGVLGILLRFLPFFGPWLVAAMPFTLALAAFDVWTPALLTFLLFAGLEVLLNNVIEPLLYSTDTGVSSVGIILAAIFWTWFWGPVGLLIAMPMTVCLAIAGNYVPQLRFLTILLGDRSNLSLEDQFYQRLLALDDDEADHLAAVYLKKHSRADFYENLVIPSLLLSEQDRHRNQLTFEQGEFILETAQELVEELADDETSAAQPDDFQTLFSGQARKKVLCLPGHDKADEITAVMLAQLLEQRGIHAETRTTDSLASELVEYVSQGEVDVVVIAALPPRASRHARYLCKRLRALLPELPIVIALWHGEHLSRTLKRLESAGATSHVHTLAEALHEIQSQCQLAGKIPKAETVTA